MQYIPSQNIMLLFLIILIITNKYKRRNKLSGIIMSKSLLLSLHGFCMHFQILKQEGITHNWVDRYIDR